LGLEIPQQRMDVWKRRLELLSKRLERLDHAQEADAAVLLKACDYALRFREIYRESDFEKLEEMLQLAETRINSLADADTDPAWLWQAGNQVRGYRSSVDGSPQPFGLVLPEGLSKDDSVPLYVWLHGRGDKITDLHFIHERLQKKGQISPPGAIVLHPFGRQCIGYKSAGETDVMEAIDFVCQEYPIDQDRIVLMGFSMGGAGVWHLAAHYSQRFCAASPGAGFAETARYQRLKPEDYPPVYEQILWRVYDVPGYVRNLFQLPVVAYSGENDKQIQAARVMEEAFASEGGRLQHLIGPGMGHKYHPDTLREILNRMATAAQAAAKMQANPLADSELFIQSPHQRYARHEWLTIDGVDQQYGDTRADASRIEGTWKLTTRNATRLTVDASHQQAPQQQVEIDGQILAVNQGVLNRWQLSGGDKWEKVDAFPSIRKRPGISGPIDDAFLEPFLVVEPSLSSDEEELDQWVKCELKFLKERWASLFRGELPTKLDRDVTDADMARYHLVIWGTPSSNLLMKRLVRQRPVGSEANSSSQSGKPGEFFIPGFTWNHERVGFGDGYQASEHIPALIYPNPLNPDRYVVINSGPTFRPAHDRTNSLQNPHLPDWTIFSLAQPRNAESAGQVVEAGFFNDQWKIDKNLSWKASD
jgi:predicted esterase